MAGGHRCRNWNYHLCTATHKKDLQGTARQPCLHRPGTVAYKPVPVPLFVSMDRAAWVSSLSRFENRTDTVPCSCISTSH